MNNNEADLKPDVQEAMLHAKRVKEFYEFLLTYVILVAVFLIMFYGQPVVYMIFIGLGVALIVQGLITFEIMSLITPNWEKKLVENKLGRKL